MQDGIRETIRRLIDELEDNRRQRLTSIAEGALVGADVDHSIVEWLPSMFPFTPFHHVDQFSAKHRHKLDQGYRMRYRNIQRTYERCRTDATRMVLEDADVKSIALPSMDDMLGYCTEVLSNTDLLLSATRKFIHRYAARWRRYGDLSARRT